MFCSPTWTQAPPSTSMLNRTPVTLTNESQYQKVPVKTTPALLEGLPTHVCTRFVRSADAICIQPGWIASTPTVPKEWVHPRDVKGPLLNVL